MLLSDNRLVSVNSNMASSNATTPATSSPAANGHSKFFYNQPNTALLNTTATNNSIKSLKNGRLAGAGNYSIQQPNGDERNMTGKKSSNNNNINKLSVGSLKNNSLSSSISVSNSPTSTTSSSSSSSSSPSANPVPVLNARIVAANSNYSLAQSIPNRHHSSSSQHHHHHLLQQQPVDLTALKNPSYSSSAAQHHKSSHSQSNTLSDRLVAKQAKMAASAVDPHARATSTSYTFNDSPGNFASLTNTGTTAAANINAPSTRHNSTHISYPCHPGNPNRLSSYDNYAISLGGGGGHDIALLHHTANSASSKSQLTAGSVKAKSGSHDHDEDVVVVVGGGGEQCSDCDCNESSEFNSETVPNYVLNNSNYGKKRASLAYPPATSTPSSARRNQSTTTMSTSAHSTSVPPPSSAKSNVFARALNYARKATTGAGNQQLNHQNVNNHSRHSSSSGHHHQTVENKNGSINGSSSSSTTSSSNKSWKAKLGKYLTPGSSTSKLNRLGVDQDGCDIILDEDMFSSYHLSRKNPMMRNQPATANQLQHQSSQDSSSIILLTPETLLTTSNSNSGTSSRSNNNTITGRHHQADLVNAFNVMSIGDASSNAFPYVVVDEDQNQIAMPAGPPPHLNKRGEDDTTTACQNQVSQAGSKKSGMKKKHSLKQYQHQNLDQFKSSSATVAAAYVNSSNAVASDADFGVVSTLSTNNHHQKPLMISSGFNSLRKIFKMSSSNNSSRQLFSSKSKQAKGEVDLFKSLSKSSAVSACATPVPTCASTLTTAFGGGPTTAAVSSTAMQYQPPSYSLGLSSTTTTTSSSASSSNNNKKSNSNISSCQTNKLVHNGTLNSINYTVSNSHGTDNGGFGHGGGAAPFLSPRIHRKHPVTNSNLDYSPTGVVNMESANDLSSYSLSKPHTASTGGFASSQRYHHHHHHQLESSSTTLDKHQLDRANNNDQQMSLVKKQPLKKQKSFSSSSTTTNTFSSSLSAHSRNAVNNSNDYATNTPAHVAADLNNAQYSMRNKPGSNKLKASCTHSPTRSYHSFREPNNTTTAEEAATNEYNCKSNGNMVKKPVSALVLNNNEDAKKSPKHQGGGNRVLSVIKMYKNVLNKIQKPSSNSNSSGSTTAVDAKTPKISYDISPKAVVEHPPPRTSLSSSCLNKLNTKALLGSQFNCVRNVDPYANNVDSSSSIFSYEFHHDSNGRATVAACGDEEKNEKIFDTINLSELDLDKSQYDSLRKSSHVIMQQSFVNNDEDMISVNELGDNYSPPQSSQVNFKQEPTRNISPSYVKKSSKSSKSKHSDTTKQKQSSAKQSKASKASSKKQMTSSNSKIGVTHQSLNGGGGGPDEDVLCDLEVASFFDNNKKFKTSIIQMDGNNFCYCYHEDDDDGEEKGNDCQQVQQNMSYITAEDQYKSSGELGHTDEEDEDDGDVDDNDDDDDDETQNLDYLVKQLVAEASLSDLNLPPPSSMKASHPPTITSNNFKMYKPSPIKTTPQTFKQHNNHHQSQNHHHVNVANNSKMIAEEFDNFDSTSLDLEKSEFVDDELGGEDKRSNSGDISGEDMNNEISLINYGPNGFQMNSKTAGISCFTQQQQLQQLNDDYTDCSLVDIDVPCNNMSLVPAPEQPIKNHDSKRSASTTYSTKINISPLNQQALLSSKGAGSGKVFIDGKSSFDGSKSNLDFNNIKIEKKIRLNYRKPHNSNNFNFGTLC